MSTLRKWASEFNVSLAAIVELERRLGLVSNNAWVPGNTSPKSEARVQDEIRLEAARLGIRLWRNNSGAYKDNTGRWVRYGLANDSAQLNERLKSPDLIGWRKRLITQDMVGGTIGQCVMREVKPEGWFFTATEHEAAQLAFMNLGLIDGCDVCFASSVGTFEE